MPLPVLHYTSHASHLGAGLGIRCVRSVDAILGFVLVCIPTSPRERWNVFLGSNILIGASFDWSGADDVVTDGALSLPLGASTETGIGCA